VRAKLGALAGAAGDRSAQAVGAARFDHRVDSIASSKQGEPVQKTARMAKPCSWAPSSGLTSIANGTADPVP